MQYTVHEPGTVLLHCVVFNALKAHNQTFLFLPSSTLAHGKYALRKRNSRKVHTYSLDVLVSLKSQRSE